MIKEVTSRSFFSFLPFFHPFFLSLSPPLSFFFLFIKKEKNKRKKHFVAVSLYFFDRMLENEGVAPRVSRYRTLERESRKKYEMLGSGSVEKGEDDEEMGGRWGGRERRRET